MYWGLEIWSLHHTSRTPPLTLATPRVPGSHAASGHLVDSTYILCSPTPPANYCLLSTPQHFCLCVKISFFILFLKIFYLCIFRGKRREKERERNINVWEIHRSVASPTAPTGDLAPQPTCPLVGSQGTCPDWETNRWRFSLQVGTQSSELHQPRLKIFKHVERLKKSCSMNSHICKT